MQWNLRDFVKRIYYITMGIYFFLSVMTVTMLHYSEVSNGAKLIRYACYVVLVFVVLYNAIEWKQVQSIGEFLTQGCTYVRHHLVLVLGIVVSLGIFLVTRERLPLILLILLWAASFYDFKQLLRIYVGATGTLMLVSFIASHYNLITEITTDRLEVTRYSMGYVYPLELVAHYLFIGLSIIYISGKAIKYTDLLLLNIFNFLLYIISDSRTSFLLLIVVSVATLILTKFKLDKLLRKVPSMIYYLFLGVCSFVLMFLSFFFIDGPEWVARLNQTLSGRIELITYAFDKYEFTLFGQKIEWVGLGTVTNMNGIWEKYNFVDNAYAKMLLDYGILFFILILIGYAVIYKTANEQKDYILIIIISVILVLSIMEPRLVSIEMNPFVLLLGRFFMMETPGKGLKLSKQQNT